jgi:PPM family protein phosphatase
MAAIQRRRGSAVRNDTALVRGAGETHRGHVRSENQDVLIVEPRLGLYAVLDGMGGTSAGDVAAHLAARSIAACIRQKTRTRQRSAEELLHLAIRTASLEVFTAGVRKREHLGMGTTVVACLVVDPTRVVIGHVGDSRAYLLRDGRLAALTRDHTVVQAMVDVGELSLDAAGRYPERHALTRCVGNPRGDPDVAEHRLRPGDRLLLCSDGLHGIAPARWIRRVLAGRGTPAQLAHRLVELALHFSAPDNVSAVVIAVDGGRARAVARRPSRARSRR